MAAVHTLFLSPADVAALIRRKGLPACFAEMAERIRVDFLRWPQFEKSARLASHSRAGVIELMPITDGERFSFKYVNGHPGNTGLGLPTVMAFGVLADVATGSPRLVSELTLTTALRTAATSALAARVLARKDSRVVALVGNGAQCEFQALAFHHLLGIEAVRLFDIDPAASARAARHLRDQGLDVTVCPSAAEGVRGVDIVTTATADKRRASVLPAGLLEPGMHLNAIGGDCPGKTELHADVLQRGRVFVEYEPQSRIEGDIQQMPADFPVTELWQVLAGAAPGRVSPKEITIFDSVGFALEDFSALCFLQDAADALGLGRRIELVPTLEDPKDLYGAITAAGMQPALRLAA